jgi:oligopeptide/dipeptide ABC transporter ATP-binding protein
MTAPGAADSSERDIVLDVRDVQVTYEMGRGRARVLDDINVEIQRGETLGIVGESGCGKSMLASALLNAVEDPGVVTGEIIYHPAEGEPMNLLELTPRQLRRVRWAEIALVYQGAMNAFNPSLPMRSHFTETFDAHNVDREAGLDRARKTLRDLNLDPDRILDAYQHELSGGEKQRVLLALSLVFDPEVLILDEPTAALDLLARRNILSLLYDIKENYDITLVYISHDIPAIAGFAERLAVMYAFDIIEFGSVRDVLLTPEHPYTRLLLQATLDLSSPVQAVQTIEGETPDPVNIPAGCPFHPRCPIADDRCEVEEPELRAEEEDDHEVACFYPDVARDRISVPFGDDDGAFGAAGGPFAEEEENDS